jgi:hypothetical protein
MAHLERIMYVELKNGGDSGPAGSDACGFPKLAAVSPTEDAPWCVHGVLPETMSTKGTGEEYWVSGVKEDGTDRHWAGSGPVEAPENGLSSVTVK